MHLLTTTETILKGFAYGSIVIWMGLSSVGYFADGDIARTILYAAGMVGYGFFGLKYVQAFKRRAYDRQYAAAKKELWNALVAALPSRGDISFERDDAEVTLGRDKLIGPFDWFSVELTEKADSTYDEETMTRREVQPRRIFRIYHNTLLVSKQFSALIIHSTKHDTDDGGVDLTITVESTGPKLAKAMLKSRQKLPEDLLYASIDELNEMSSDIKNYMNGTAS